MIAVDPIAASGGATLPTGVSERRDRELPEGATLAVLLQNLLTSLAPLVSTSSTESGGERFGARVGETTRVRASILDVAEAGAPEPRSGIPNLGRPGSDARLAAAASLPAQLDVPEASSDGRHPPVRGPEPEGDVAGREPRLQLVAVQARTVVGRREPGVERPSLQGTGIAYDAGVLLTVEATSPQRPVPARQEVLAEASVPVELVALPEHRLAVELRDDRLGRIELRIEQVQDRYDVHLRIQEGEAVRMLQRHHDGLRRELAEVLAGDVRLHLGAGAGGDGHRHGRSADDGAPRRKPRWASGTVRGDTEGSIRTYVTAEQGTAERRRWRVHHEA